MSIIKTVPSSAKGIYLKLGLIILLLGLGFVSYHFATAKPKKNAPTVLGQETNIVDTGKVIKSAENAISGAKKNIYGAAQEAAVVIGDTATKSAQTVKEYLIDSTVSNAVKQLDKLPPAAQEKVKEYICK